MKTVIPVVWWHRRPDTMSRNGVSMHIMNDLFDGTIAPLEQYSFTHHDKFQEVPLGTSGVVVVVSGRAHPEIKDILALDNNYDIFGGLSLCQ